MKILAEINEASLGFDGGVERFGEKYELRKSARVILLNGAGKIAIQCIKNHGHHKLPGGGVDQGESIEKALKREVLEEVGCDCEIIQPVGIVIEYRNKSDLLQISYCYVAKVVGEIGEAKLEEAEINQGLETLWLKPEEALQKMKTDQPTKFQGHFILKREITFLEEYFNIFNEEKLL